MTNKEVMQMALNALITAELDGNCEYGATDALRKALAQPEKEWVGLTEKDIVGCFDLMPPKFARTIEAKLKEKNT